MAKRYYWLKLKKDFFKSVRMKKLRKIAGGDTFTIIYLKLLLETMDTDGMYKFQHTCESIEEEIAFELDEEVDNVSVTLKFLESVGLLQEVPDKESLLFTEVSDCVGSESDSAKRVREFRQKQLEMSDKSGKALHCNNDVTDCNKNVTLEIRDKREDIRVENRERVEDREEKKKNIDSNESIRQTETVCGSHSDDEKPHVPVKKIVEMWNTLTEFGITPVSKIDSKSKRYIAARARGYQYTEEDFQKAIDNIRHSDFLCGKKTDFIITFDWFVKASNFEKVYDGNYNNRENTGGGSKLDEWLKEE